MEHKCNNCGTEFDGNFCPNCGASSKNTRVCPHCGAEVSNAAKFCNNCGRAIEVQQNPAPITQPRQSKEPKPPKEPREPIVLSENFFKVLNKILKWMPCVIFALFSVLNFVFMACTAYGMFGMPMGTVYESANGDYSAMVTALIVFAAVSAAYTLAYPLLVGKRPIASHVIALALCAALLASSCAFYVQVGKDGWSVEAALKLLISFSVVFAVLIGSAVLADVLLCKRSKNYLDAKTAAANKPTFLGKLAQVVKSWFVSHKKTAVGIAVSSISVALVCVLVFVVIVPIATNIFSEKRLSQIALGDSKETVVSKIGKPYGDQQSNVWEYYGDEMLTLLKQQDDLNKKAENLTDLSQLTGLMEQQAALSEKIEKTTYRYIVVNFDNSGNVSALAYDAKHSRHGQTGAKETSQVKFNGKKDVIDLAAFAGKDALQVSVSYKDGSYKSYAMPKNITATFSEAGENRLFPSSGKITWSDDWGEHSQNVTIDDSNYNFEWWYYNYDEELYLNGDIPTRAMLDFFQIEDYPWAGKTVEDIRFGADVTAIPPDVVSSFSGDLIVDADNKTLSSQNGMIFDNNNDLVWAGNASLQSIRETDWWQKQPDGEVYLRNSLLGYKGEMAENYSLAVRDGTRTIHSGALKDAVNLVSVTIPDSVTSIGDDAFYGCSNLGSVALGNGVKSIKNSAFFGCSKLSRITIPNSVTSIGEYAFRDCRSLTSIIIPISVTSIGESAFYESKSLTIYCEATSRLDGWYDGWNYQWNGDCPVVWDCNNNMKDEDGYEYAVIDGLRYKFKDSVATLVVQPSNVDYALTIPASVSYNNAIYDVGAIDSNVFSNCGDNLLSVTIHSGVEIIASYAFEGCYKLVIYCETTSESSWGYQWNGDCPVVWDCKNNSKDEKGYEYATIDGIRYRLKDSIAEVFRQSSAIKEVDIPSSVLYKNTDYTVMSIDSYAFSGCNNLASVTIPDSVTSIGEDAFRGCNNLASINVSSGNTKYHSEGDCLIETASKTLVLGCKNSVIPADDSVTSIGDSAFYGCRSLTTITIPDSVTSIGNDAFSGCSSLSSVTLGNGVTTIGGFAFYECNSLTSIAIPNSVTSIGSNAFECRNLEIIYWNATACTSSASYSPSFQSANLTKIVIGDNVKVISGRLFNYNYSLACVDYLGNVASWCDISGLVNIMSVGVSDKKLYIDNQEVKGELVIPDGVTKINSYAFFNCNDITSVIIPNSVTSIGDSAFYGCRSLTTITIPDSVTSIGWRAFGDCSNLKYNEYYNALYLGNVVNPYVVLVEVKSTDISSYIVNENTKVIYANAFTNCSNLMSITIGNSVTSIGDSAFSGCSSLTTITIPDSVTSIGWRAFEDCINLTSITFEGTIEQWNSISKGYDWCDRVPATQVVCSDGTVAL